VLESSNLRFDSMRFKTRSKLTQILNKRFLRVLKSRSRLYLAFETGSYYLSPIVTLHCFFEHLLSAFEFQGIEHVFLPHSLGFHSSHSGPPCSYRLKIILAAATIRDNEGAPNPKCILMCKVRRGGERNRENKEQKLSRRT
jgi:hypothetical protein